MNDDRGVFEATELFKALSSPSRLSLLLLLGRGEATVSDLVQATGQSQPLVSQHLRVLRLAGVVAVTRTGREALYVIADRHVTTIVNFALEHVRENLPDSEPPENTPQRSTT